MQKIERYLLYKYRNEITFNTITKNENKLYDSILICHIEYHPRCILPCMIEKAFRETLKSVKLFDHLFICNSRQNIFEIYTISQDTTQLSNWTDFIDSCKQNFKIYRLTPFSSTQYFYFHKPKYKHIMYYFFI